MPLLLLFSSSILSGIASRLFLHPFDTLRTIKQTSPGNKPITLSRLYRGLPISLALTVPAQTTYISSYILSKSSDSVTDHAKAAFIAEMTSSVFWTPMDVVKLYSQHFDVKTADSIRMIYRTGGIKGFYKGYLISLTVYIPFSIIYFCSYEWLKDKMITPGENLPFMKYALSSGMAAAAAVVSTNAMDIIKTRVQIGLMQGHKEGLVEIVRKEGMMALSKGMGMRLAYNIPATCVGFTVFEVAYHLGAQK